MDNIDVVSKYWLFEDLFRKLVRSVSIDKKELKVLDLGCGNKPYEKLIKKTFNNKNIEYIGVDFYSEVADIKLDINNNKIPFIDNYFDIIICTEVLEHLYEPLSVINEIKRLSKKEGVVLITTPFLFPIHEKKHDYFRFTFNFYRYIFKDFNIISENISNTFLSFPFYIINYMIGSLFPNDYKIVSWLSIPFDKLALFLFPKKHITYSYYMDYGILLKNSSKEARQK